MIGEVRSRGGRVRIGGQRRRTEKVVCRVCGLLGKGGAMVRGGCSGQPGGRKQVFV